VELEAMCDVSPDEESSMTCSRVRPVNKVRRRRIIDTYGLHHRLPKAAKVETTNFSAVLRIRDILVRMLIRGSVPLTDGSGSCYFLFFAYYFLKVHLHHILQR
jgi:hypothetical protein